MASKPSGSPATPEPVAAEAAPATTPVPTPSAPPTLAASQSAADNLFKEIAASGTAVAGETYEPILFSQLAAFDFRPFGEGEGTTESALAQIPEAVRKLDNRLVETVGYMMPVEADSTGVHMFLLMRDQSLCCFGVLPRPNDWMLVTMAEGKTAEYFADVPVRVAGRLSVGPRDDEHGAAIVYRMEGHRLSGPQ